VVPIAVVLHELCFIPDRPGDEDTRWRWSGTHEGVELYVFAGQDMFGLWNLTGTCIQPREKMFHEQVLPEKAPRGLAVMRIAKMWQLAFSRDVPVPGRFEIGLLYERHLAEMRSLEVGLPTLRADGKVLRATRGWLSERMRLAQGEVGPPPDVRMRLIFGDGLLRLEAGDCVYGVPARGVWGGDCEVSLREFLAIPYWQLRGYEVALERCCEAVAFNGDPVSITGRSVDAQA